MVGYQILTTLMKNVKIEYTIYSKKQKNNPLIAVEATILLDIVKTIYNKSKQIQLGSIILYIDN